MTQDSQEMPREGEDGLPGAQRSEKAELLPAVRVESPRHPPHHGPLCPLALGTLPGTGEQAHRPRGPRAAARTWCHFKILSKMIINM